MNKSPYFGPGGNSEAFYATGHRSSAEAPAWLREIGLNAYEYQAGNGLTAGKATLTAIGQAARAADIRMSLHAPYFISLSGVIPEKRQKSIAYIRDSLSAAEQLSAYLIVVHTGSAARISREQALLLAEDTLYRLLEEVPDNGALIGLETMGKINQLGTLEEVIRLCRLSPRLVPVVDFGHLNAREHGEAFLGCDDYRRVFDRIGETLGDSTARNLHCHFSKIEWTSGGEKKHLTFADREYGPPYEPLMEIIAREALTPTLICESAGTMSDDALLMKQYYERMLSS